VPVVFTSLGVVSSLDRFITDIRVALLYPTKAEPSSIIATSPKAVETSAIAVVAHCCQFNIPLTRSSAFADHHEWRPGGGIGIAVRALIDEC
jgi:hypothetical protein